MSFSTFGTCNNMKTKSLVVDPKILTFTVSNVTDTTLKLNWTSVGGNKVDVYNNVTKIGSNLSVLFLNVTGLTANTTYTFNIKFAGSTTVEKTVSQKTTSPFVLPITGTTFTQNATTTVNGVSYTFSASSSTSADPAYKAFNNNSISGNFWSSAFNGISSYTLSPYYTDGVYQGGGSSSYQYSTGSGTTSLSGEWVQVQTNANILINKYGLLNRSGNTDKRNPKIYALYGSNDGSTFTQIDQQTTSTTSDTNYLVTVSPSTTYKYYRLVINKLNSDASTRPCNLCQFNLVGNM